MLESLSFVVGFVIGYSFCKCVGGDCQYLLKMKQGVSKAFSKIKEMIFAFKKSDSK